MKSVVRYPPGAFFYFVVMKVIKANLKVILHRTKKGDCDMHCNIDKSLLVNGKILFYER